MNLLGFALLLACAPSALMDYAIPRWKNDKEMRIEDAYKWTYQATRGGEHAVPDRESARTWLEREWQTMGDEPKNENEWVALCPGGEIGRLNLRAFRSGGGKMDDILDAFLASATEYKSEPKAFTDAWAELGKRLKAKSVGTLTHKEWLRLDTEMKKKDYPAVHHSEPYKKANRPAYRIITRLQAQRIIPS
jgi:hypothetical protein